MKKIFLILLMIFLLPINVSASEDSNVDVTITTEAANVGNMNFRIVRNDEIVLKPLSIKIVSDRLNEDIDIVIDDGILFIQNLPYGTYEINVCDENVCEVFEKMIDKDTVLSQHKTTDLVLKPTGNFEIVDTGDNDLTIYFGVAGLCVVCFYIGGKIYAKNR